MNNLQANSKFSIGDAVKVNNCGKAYTSYKEMAEKWDSI